MESERERGQVPQPPAKRMKLAPVVPARGGGGGGQVASPRWRRLRQTLLVVLYLVRARTTETASMVCPDFIAPMISQLQRSVNRTFHKYHEMISSKLESFQEQIEGLRQEVAQLSRMCSSRHADQQIRLEANQEVIAANGSNTNMRLCFLNDLEPPVYTDENLTSQNHGAIKVAMFEGDKVVTSGALSKAKIEILVLRGDFSNKCQDNWTEDEFDKHIAKGRDEHDLVLGTIWLTNGIGELSQIRFREGSCRKKFIVAARVCKSKKTSDRVQEAIMKPVKVLDRRNKSNEKKHPPRLNDDLYRLEEIAKDGAYHKRLHEAQILNVEGFLKALNEDPNNLRAILRMENHQNAWSKLTEHARECVLEDQQVLKRYHSEEGNVVLFFNCVHELVGAAFPHEYVACQSFNATQKALVNKWRCHAYAKLKDISLDFVMKGNIPEPISPIANCSPTIPNNGPNMHYYQVMYLPGTGTAENLPQGEHGTPYIADCGPILADPDYLNTHYSQDQGIPLHGQQQVISPWTQSPQGMMDLAWATEVMQITKTSSSFAYPLLHRCFAHILGRLGMNCDLLYQDSGASISAQAQLMFGPAAASPWMPSMAEQDQGTSCSGFPGSDQPHIM